MAKTPNVPNPMTSPMGFDPDREMTRKEILRSRAQHAGMKYDTWAPGDGITRYRFAAVDDPSDDYFGFRSSASMTSLGISAAEDFVDAVLFGQRHLTGRDF